MPATARTWHSNLELDLGTCELKMTGVLRTSYQHQMWQGMAAHIMYARISPLCLYERLC